MLNSSFYSSLSFQVAFHFLPGDFYLWHQPSVVGKFKMYFLPSAILLRFTEAVRIVGS